MRSKKNESDGVSKSSGRSGDGPRPASGMHIDIRDPCFIYGCWDLFFSLVYLFVFTVLMPSHHPTTRFLTLFFPGLLAAGGVYLAVQGPRARQVGLGLAILFLTLCLGILATLSYTIGMFRGIYGPLGTGISVISAILMVMVVFLVGVWPVFQMRAFWPVKRSS